MPAELQQAIAHLLEDLRRRIGEAGERPDAVRQLLAQWLPPALWPGSCDLQVGSLGRAASPTAASRGSEHSSKVAEAQTLFDISCPGRQTAAFGVLLGSELRQTLR